jgi:hypothetical protein
MKVHECLDKCKNIGTCLKGGELVESPFDLPFEEESHKDADQSDDDRNFIEDNVSIRIENSHSKKQQIISEDNKDIFRFFLDGSLRTKFIGEYIEQEVSFPILLSEIAVAVVRRDGKKLMPFKTERGLYSGSISDDVYDKLKELKDRMDHSNTGVYIEFLNKSEYKGDLRWSMQGKARDLMHKMEHSLAKSIERSEDDWLVMDGAIRKSEFLNLDRTIGLAKSFSRKPAFDMGGSRPLTITNYLKELQIGERSLVFRKKNALDDVSKNVGFWFVRIRKSPPMMEPLGGIVKIDYKTKSDNLSAEELSEVNSISAEVFAMSLPSVYPWPRWPNYVYPIRLAEQYMSSNFINPEHLSYMGKVMKDAIKR